MRLRIRGPEGNRTVNIDGSSTVGDLRSNISAATGLAVFDLKIGYPPKSLDLDQFDNALQLSETGLELNGEQLLAAKRDVPASLQTPLSNSPVPPPRISQSARSQPTSTTQFSGQAPLPSTPTRADADMDPPEIPVPASQGTLVQRVMPDDNSCLFRALSYAVLGTGDVMHELRGIVAATIQSQPDIYDEAVLEKSPDDYCRWINREDSWGGAIELGILSQHFDVEICSINVQDLRNDRFNEGKRTRCILVYSGIHYDVIVLNKSSPPYEKANAPPELDQKIFDNDDDPIMTGALMLCKKLQDRHYYTDTAGFTIQCGICGWQGQGERAAIKHATETNHNDFGEAT